MMYYAITIFLSSFLLFQLQPLIGRYILPWYGGTPSVWTTCLVFFQVALLAGYCYAHLLTALDKKKQAALHVGLVIVSLYFLPITPSPEWKLSAADGPTWNILLLLLSTIGIPYFILSATTPLLQHWFIRSHPIRSPYRLYALSNFGSFLALLSYPFLIEPKLALATQTSFWSGGYSMFAVACCCCALLLWRSKSQTLTAEAVLPHETSTAPSLPKILHWILLAACTSAALIATSNLLCQDIAVVPFLWIAPLAIYLITFTICFGSKKPHSRMLWGILLTVAVVAVALLQRTVQISELATLIVAYNIALLALCMAGHGELSRAKPAPGHLTTFYLATAAGGAMGGVFASLLAPVLFNDFIEYPIILTASSLIIAYSIFIDRSASQPSKTLPVFIVTAQLLAVLFFYRQAFLQENFTVEKIRNFYGVIKLLHEKDSLGKKLVLKHGNIWHGSQYLDPLKGALPTTYYGRESGAALAINYHPRRFSAEAGQRNLKIGIIGLGAGTLARYGQPGDTITFYEINPAVITVASNNFTNLRSSPAKTTIIAGDARIMLEKEHQQNGSHNYDVLIVDAFSSDAIPVHLLTRECFAIYRQHLKKDGILAFHVTNAYVDLLPVVFSLGRESGSLAMFFSSRADAAQGTSNADWVTLITDTTFLFRPEISSKIISVSPVISPAAFWTDDYASLFSVLAKPRE